MPDPIIEVRNLSKKYRLGDFGRHTFREHLDEWWHRLWRKNGHAEKGVASGERRTAQANGSQLAKGEEPATGESGFWALRDVSFSVQPGEVVGIIGRNGAGKSTLLKILSRITEPTEGEAILSGRVASLLEVGTGFHPELTGRENVFLSGAILGMRKSEIRRRFDEIVAFAEVDRFIDTPVKRYSSGMYVRLGFAVAAHLSPEILIVDEVLAVGDVEFQKKCLGKMGLAAGEGRTIIFVSHNIAAVKRLCTRGILLTGGRLAKDADTVSVAEAYLTLEGGSSMRCQIPWPGDSTSAITRVKVTPLVDEDREYLFAGEPWAVEIQISADVPLPHCIVGCGLTTTDGTPIHTFWTAPQDLPAGRHRITFRYNKIQISAAHYRLAVGLSSYERAIHYVEDTVQIRVENIPGANVEAIRTSGTGYLLNPVESEIQACIGDDSE